MNISIGKYNFLAEPFHCDFKGELLLTYLGNYLLNAADFHANERNFGLEQLKLLNKNWVLSRLAFRIIKPIKAYTKIEITTWIEEVTKFFIYRNFEIKDLNNGEVLGYARSIWAIIDFESRQPVNILEVEKGAIAKYENMEKECDMPKCGRAKLDNDLKLKQSQPVVYEDLDLNIHVNSIKYIQKALNSINVSWHKNLFVTHLDVAYVAECPINSILNIYQKEVNIHTIQTSITSINNDTNVEKECCRMIIKAENRQN